MIVRRQLLRSLVLGSIALAVAPPSANAVQAVASAEGYADVDASIDIPLHKQEHPLSCEAAALQMAMAAQGCVVAEADILSALPRDRTPRIVRPDGSVEWGDPDRGFVGNWDGIFAKDGYGVYDGPIADVAVGYGFAGTVHGRDVDPGSLYAAIGDGWPSIIWIPYGLMVQGRGAWLTPEGSQIDYVVTEHAVVLAATSAAGVTCADPYTGSLRRAAYADFEAAMAELGNRAVTLHP